MLGNICADLFFVWFLMTKSRKLSINPAGFHISAAQQVGGRKGQDDKRGTQHDKGIILRNIGIRILVGSQQVKNRMPE